jgi:hypothetical protein
MRYAIFGFSTPNLGDDIQALAAALLLPRVDAYVDRDRLDKVSLTEPHHVIMNSWFAIKRYAATPSASILPHYFSQCIGRPELLNDAWLNEWRRRAPIGCRDTHSVSLLQERGIDAHFTGCLTTWMGRFFQPPEKREGIIFVDVPPAMERFIPESIRAHARRITNETVKGESNQLSRFRKIAEICDILRNAEMVVTRRLHTALPCVGFGTPVTVYLQDDEKNRQRFSGSDAFLPIVFHNGEKTVDEKEWLEPAASALPADMERHFDDLLAKFDAKAEPKWTSMAQFVETLPDLPRHPRSLLQRVRAA